MEVRHRKGPSSTDTNSAAKSFPSDWNYSTFTFRNETNKKEPTLDTSIDDDSDENSPLIANSTKTNRSLITTQTKDWLIEYLLSYFNYFWETIANYVPYLEPQVEPHVKEIAVEIVCGFAAIVPDCIGDSIVICVRLLHKLRWNLQYNLDDRVQRSIESLMQSPVHQAHHFVAFCNVLYRSKMEKFKQHISISYDTKNPEHEDKLLHLWKVSFPNKELEARVSAQWKKLGFQGTDPMTDFRGAGIFGLNNLLYLAETYPNRFHQLAHNETKSGTKIHGESYPFAITGFNVTMVILEMLGWGMKRDNESKARKQLIKIIFSGDRDPNTLHHSVAAFSEVYVLIFHIFDLEWKSAKAKYMDFPTVLTTTKGKVEAQILKLPSYDSLKEHNRKFVHNHEHVL